MKNKVTRATVIAGIAWRFGERIGAQAVSFAVSIILARLLAPNDFGMVAMVLIFIDIANVFVTSGFGSALIQKKDADNVDFSSVFYFSIAVSIVLYMLLYISAPLIGSFYNQQQLAVVLRVLALKLPIAAVNSVQHAYVSREMLFRRFFFSTLGGTIVSAAIGIIMAYRGYGIWSLVAQYLIKSLMDALILWFTIRWRPQLLFSLQRMGKLFSFGWKLLGASLIQTLYLQFRSLVIGKVYTSADLAFYQKGKQIPSLIVTNINSSISSVLFPAMARSQHDLKQLKQQVRRAIKVSSYIMWPLMAGLAVISEPLVLLLLTEKWLPAVVFLRLACFQLAFEPIQTANLQAIMAVGRSDLFLKMEIIKKTVAVLSVIAVMRISVLAIALSGVFYVLFAALVNSTPNRKLLGYSFREQIGDIISPVLLVAVMFAPVFLLGLLPIPLIARLLVQVIGGAAVYVGLSVAFRIDSFTYLVGIYKSHRPQKNEEEI